MNLLTVKQVASKLAFSEGWVWAMLKKDPTFPKPIKVGAGGESSRATRWIDESLDDWLLTKQQHTEIQENDNGRTGSEVHTAAGKEVAA